MKHNTHKNICCHCGHNFRFHTSLRKHLLVCWRTQQLPKNIVPVGDSSIFCTQQTHKNIEQKGNGTEVCTINNRPHQTTKNSVQVGSCPGFNSAQDETEAAKDENEAEEESRNANLFRLHCKVCNVKFRSLSHYCTHIRRKGLCRQRPYACQKCGKVFNTVHHLLAHEKRKTSCASHSTSFEIVKKNVINFPDQEVRQQILQVYKRSGSIHVNPLQHKQLYRRHVFQGHPYSSVEKMLTRKKAKELTYRYKEKLNTCQLSIVSCTSKSKKKYKCRCGRTFTFLHNLREHLKWKAPYEPSQHFVSGSSLRKSIPLTDEHTSGTEKQPFVHPQTDKHSISKKMIKYNKLRALHSHKQNLPSTVGDMNKFKCLICKKTFLKSSTLKKHLNEHKLSKHFKGSVNCPGCSQVFRSAYLLYRHQQKYEHWSEVMKTRIQICYCPICGQQFSYVGSRNRHICIHEEEYPSKVKLFLEETSCELCGRLFLSKHQKAAHKESYHTESKRTCKSNSNRSMNTTEVEIKSEVKEHLTQTFESRSITQKKKIKQENLKANIPEFHRNHSFTVNSRNQKANNPFWTSHKCKWCQKKFSSPYYLLHHVQTFHDGELMFQCLKCSLKFPTYFQAVQHISMMHKNSPVSSLLKKLDNKSGKCNNDVVFEKKGLLLSQTNKLSKSVDKDLYFSAHIWKIDDDTGRGIYSCDLCHINSFTKMSSYYRHKKSHLHRKNLLCQKLSLIQPPTCETQNVSHNIICSVCSESYNSLTKFITHRLNHFNTKRVSNLEINEQNPFKCEICCKAFYHRVRVQSHLLWHLRSDKAHFNGIVSYKESGSDFGFSLNDKVIAHEIEPEIYIAKKSIIGLFTEKELKDQKDKLCSESKKIICEKCDLQFTSMKNYTTHIHKFCQLFSCDYCMKTFSSKKGQTLHKRYCKTKFVGKLKCRHCFLDFTSGSDLGWHEKSCRKVHNSERGQYCRNFDEEKLFECRYCHQMFLNVSLYQAHELLHCNKNVASKVRNIEHELDRPSEKVNSEVSLKRSSKYSPGDYSENGSVKSISAGALEESSILSLYCSPSSLVLPKRENGIQESENVFSKLDSSKRNEANIIVFHCPYCTTVFEDETQLLEHLVIHSPFKCSLCGKVEETVVGYRKHSCLLNEGDFSSKIFSKRKIDITMPATQKSHSDVSATETLRNKNASFQVKKIDFNFNNHFEHLKSYCHENVTTNKSSDMISGVNARNIRKQSLIETLGILRDNFSQLLYLLIADPELMMHLGWGKKLIDVVLEDVLVLMGQQPLSFKNDLNELECLRKNIQILLQLCIKDHVMSSVMDCSKLVDDVVIEMLEMCKSRLNGYAVNNDFNET